MLKNKTASLLHAGIPQAMRRMRRSNERGCEGAACVAGMDGEKLLNRAATLCCERSYLPGGWVDAPVHVVHSGTQQATLLNLVLPRLLMLPSPDFRCLLR